MKWRRSALGVLVGVTATIIATQPGAARADTIRDSQWHLTFLDINRAHEIARGEGVVVAVIDSGVDASHPDLAKQVIPGTDLTGTSDLSEVDPRGYADVLGHGTAMAGLIAANGRALGIAPAATILPVRTIASGGSFGGINTANGVSWAISHGARVINLSTGVEGRDTRLEAAVRDAEARDVVVVAAAGNTNTSDTVPAPAAYPGVLAVGAVGRDGQHSAFSVTGPEVMIAAPGDDITSTAPGGGYTQHDSGTSSATAIVSGAVALIRSKYPKLTAPEVIKLITSTADDKGDPGKDNVYGYGVLNIVKALTTPLPTPTATATPPSTSTGGSTRWIVVGAIVAVLLAGAGVITLARRNRGVT